MKSIQLKKNAQIILILFSIFIAQKFNEKSQLPKLKISKQETSLNLNSNLLNIFSMGNKRFFTSLLWVATILESDVDHYKGKDLDSWMFHRFSTISILEPKFYETYRFGGLYLSVIKDDLEGASWIYNKGLTYYPDDFGLLQDAAYHFHFERSDFKKSYELFSRLKKNPKANPIMISTLAKLEKNNGNKEIAFQILKDQYERIQNKEDFLAKKIFNDLYSIRAEIDLECLNGNDKKTCNLVDLENNKYQYKDGIYRAKKEWKLFGLKKRKAQD